MRLPDSLPAGSRAADVDSRKGVVHHGEHRSSRQPLRCARPHYDGAVKFPYGGRASHRTRGAHPPRRRSRSRRAALLRKRARAHLQGASERLGDRRRAPRIRRGFPRRAHRAGRGEAARHPGRLPHGIRLRQEPQYRRYAALARRQDPEGRRDHRRRRRDPDDRVRGVPDRAPRRRRGRPVHRGPFVRRNASGLPSRRKAPRRHPRRPGERYALDLSARRRALRGNG